ncbi:hypothetical protein [Tamilnaduibacter salinus]|uniref:hypothetical protein n=1 Tax=Tamilnaduibacter salinus TaxID=1484056 RepID=UPI001B8045A5|nr:hypothetical protein [Tamilnaduibacter salinus]
MTESNAKEASPHAGKVDTFPTGRLTYLSPRPLPTGYPPVDHGHAIGKVTGHYLDFGVGHSNAFSWQLVIGGSFVLFLISAVVGPLLGFAGGYHFGNGWEDAVWAVEELFKRGFWLGIGGALLVFSISMLPVRKTFQQAEKIYPTRFNRQRREVCFVPEGEEEPIFVPWEQLQAWILESQGVSEYGVRRQYGFGVGFHHPETGERFTLEFETHGRPLAISNWEALRA